MNRRSSDKLVNTVSIIPALIVLMLAGVYIKARFEDLFIASGVLIILWLGLIWGDAKP